MASRLAQMLCFRMSSLNLATDWLKHNVSVHPKVLSDLIGLWDHTYIAERRSCFEYFERTLGLLLSVESMIW